jgi:hypothetical protein
MSSVAGSGRFSQIGAMHRAEKVNRELQEMRDLLKEVREVPALVASLQKSVSDLRERLDALNIPKMAEPVTMDHIDDLETKIDALRSLQGSQVSTTALQALERRIDSKIALARAAATSHP